MKEFAKRKGLDVAGVTSDVGSGLDAKRKGLLEIAKVSKLKKADMILTRSIDRISRNFIEAIKFICQIKKHIEFRTIDDLNGKFIEYELMFLTALKNIEKERIA